MMTSCGTLSLQHRDSSRVIGTIVASADDNVTGIANHEQGIISGPEAVPPQQDMRRIATLQVLALIAMEKPVSGNADDIRDEKVKVIRCISPAQPEDCVLGQYAAANGKPGYHDDDTVPKGSKAPTFATIVLNVHNERYAPCSASHQQHLL